MILLYGAIATLLTSGAKWLGNKVGIELAEAWTLLFLFAICLAWALVENFLVKMNIGFWENLVGSYSLAIAMYETATKNILKPVINNLKK